MKIIVALSLVLLRPEGYKTKLSATIIFIIQLKTNNNLLLLHGGSYNRWCHNYHCFGIILVGEWHKIFIVTQKYHIGTSLGTWLIPIRPALRLFAPKVALRNYPH